jgi:hypothetical protein
MVEWGLDVARGGGRQMFPFWIRFSPVNPQTAPAPRKVCGEVPAKVGAKISGSRVLQSSPALLPSLSDRGSTSTNCVPSFVGEPLGSLSSR